VFFTIGVVGWAAMARLVRGQVLVVRQLEFVQASKALGARDTRIVFRHVLPSVVAPVLIAATLGVAETTPTIRQPRFIWSSIRRPRIMLKLRERASMLSNPKMPRDLAMAESHGISTAPCRPLS